MKKTEWRRTLMDGIGGMNGRIEKGGETEKEETNRKETSYYEVENGTKEREREIIKIKGKRIE